MLEIVNILLALYTIEKERWKAAKVIKLITDFMSVRHYLLRQKHGRDYYGVVWMCVQTHCSQADKSRGEICICIYVTHIVVVRCFYC